jgi:hypothetical protein
MGENETSEAVDRTPDSIPLNARDESQPEVEPLSSKVESHLIAMAISRFVHSIRDIESLARTYLPLSVKRRGERLHQIGSDIEENVELLKEGDRASQVLIITKVLDAVQKLERLSLSNAPRMLQTSLFLGMFSAYDIFTGELLTAIYGNKPELFKRVNRSITVSEILQYDSFDNLKAVVLQAEIETFRRKSYVEQFEDLQSTFGIELKAFERWPQFVECAQRRNLITHCGGIVNEQYIKICEKEGYSFASPVTIGEKLELDKAYFLSSCELIMEVGFKLGQTLWRKVFPDEVEQSDDHLTHVLYQDCLRMERWDRAVVFGEFAVDQKRLSSDVTRKICIINYAIGLKFAGRPADASKALSEVDWSGAASDFKLGEAVLSDRFDEAAEIMKRIGKKGEFVSERSYHEWPLFHEFRKTAQFFNAYESIFGYPFAVEVQRAAAKAQAATKEEIEKQASESNILADDESTTGDEVALLAEDNSAVSRLATPPENSNEPITE